MRRSIRLSLFVALCASPVACGGGGGTSGPRESSLAGAWKWQSGPLIETEGFGTLRYLDLHADGSGAILGSTPLQQAPYCMPVLFAVLGGSRVAFDVPALVNGDGTLLPPSSYAWHRAGDTLTLTDPAGIETVFTRESSVPAADACVMPAVGTPIPMPAGFVPDYQRSALIGEANGNVSWSYAPQPDSYPIGVVSFSPSTQTTSAVFATTSSYPYAVASQAAGDYWRVSQAGHDNDIQRYTGATMVDDVSTVALGYETGIEGADWDGTHLWLAGGDFSGAAPGRVLEVNSAAERDLLVRTDPSDLFPLGIAVRNGTVYVLGEYLGLTLVVATDANSGALLGAWTLPSNGIVNNLPYYSLANANGMLYTMSPSADPSAFFLVPLPGI